MVRIVKPLDGAAANTAPELEQDLPGKSDAASAMHPQTQSPLLQLPGEIRNKIYYYALDMRLIRSLRPSAPDPSAPDYTKLQEHFEQDQSSMNLLLACKIIYREAGSYFADTTLAQVPLQALKRLNPTSKRALNSFMNVAILYPVENERKKRKGINSRRVTNEQYGWALLKALKLYTRASPKLCEERALRRQAWVDHKLRWPTRLQFARSITKMAKDKFTDWSVGISYEYFETGSTSELQDFRNIAWAKDECAKQGKRITFDVLLLHGGPAKRTLPLIEEILYHPCTTKGHIFDSVLESKDWYSVLLSF